MLNKIKIEDLHIGDTVITKDNEKGIIVQLNSVTYLNYQNNLSMLDDVSKLLYKFNINDNKKKENTFYKDIIIYIESEQQLLGISANNIKCKVNIKKNNIINKLKKILKL